MFGGMESMFGFENYDKQNELEEEFAKKFSIDITPYVPLAVLSPSLLYPYILPVSEGRRMCQIYIGISKSPAVKKRICIGRQFPGKRLLRENKHTCAVLLKLG